MSPALDLQIAIVAALRADAALVAALGGAKIHDFAPASAAFPYVTFGRTSVFDGDTASETGTEQFLTLHVWSRAKGRREALGILGLIRARLHDGELGLTSSRLVNLRAESEEVRFEDDVSAYRGVIRFRAVTEDVTP